jgi:DNA-binding response OmpR family regulator
LSNGTALALHFTIMQVLRPVSSFERPLRILVVDTDDSAYAWIAPSLHNHLSAVVEQLRSGGELYDKLMVGGADLVITNAQLPEHSGLQVLARCRAHDSTVPFIVFTAFPDDCMRVFVSDADGTVLSSRVVDARAMTALAASLVDPTRARHGHITRPRTASLDAT